jgi:photosystem II stability/assembly factor-like uncharacterized protein
MKTHLLVILIFVMTLAQTPLQWNSRGPGGGGALFAPCINPGNDNEYYLSCDMGEVFHTTDFGLSYSIVDFRALQGFHNSTVRLTVDPAVRYSINYANYEIVPVISADGGATWNTLPGNVDASEETYSIFADYDNPPRVLISYYGAIYYSQDHGNSFTKIHTARNSGSGVAVGGVFFNGASIYIGTNDGLLVSNDGGSNFSPGTMAGIPAGQCIYAFAGASAGNVTRLFCLTADTNNIWAGKSADDFWNTMKGVYSLDIGGAPWVSRMTGLVAGTDFPMFICMAGNDVNTVYLGGSNASGLASIFKSTDAGGHWTQSLQLTNNQNMITGWCGDRGDINWGWSGSLFGLCVAPKNANKALFTDWGFVHKTADGGATWQQAYTSVGDQHSAGSTTPTARSYHSIGLENTSCWQVFWSDSSNLFAAFTDIKGVRSVDAGNSWSFNYTGHSQNTMYWIARNSSSGTLYAATSSIHDLYESTYLQDSRIDATGATGKILFSTDKGATWITSHDFSHPVYWVALDPNDANKAYASVVNHAQAVGGIYACANLSAGTASAWTKLPDPPRTEGHPAVIAVLNDGKVVCTYSGRRDAAGAFTASSGVFVYSPANATWSDVSHPSMRYWTRDIVMDPHDAAQNTWYVCVYSGWGGPPNDLGGLFKTVNRGSTWTKINSLHSVSSCAIDPANGNAMYVTTETNALWYSPNVNAASPTFTLVQSYPFSHPQRVFFNPYKPGEIWVASFGNGMRVGNTNGNNIREPFASDGKYFKGKFDGRSMTIYSLNGAVIRTIDVPQGLSSPNRIVSRLAAGVYFVKIHGMGTALIRKAFIVP